MIAYLLVVDPHGTPEQQTPVKKTETILAVTADSNIARMQAELHVRKKQVFMPESEVTKLHVTIKRDYHKDVALECLESGNIAFYPIK